MATHDGPLAAIRDGTNQLEKIRELAAELPPEYRAIVANLLRATADELSPVPNHRPSLVASSNPSVELAVQRIADFFRARGNRPSTLNEVGDGTGIPYVTLRTFVYKRHASKFVKTKSPPGKATLWQWAELLSKHGPEKKDGKSRETER